MPKEPPAKPGQRSGKSASAFRTISEVADDLGVAQHVLRFWETKFSQIRPMKRGGGRRYYRPQDVDLLRGIRALLYDQGYTIKGVQKILRENGGRMIVDAAAGSVAASGEGDDPSGGEVGELLREGALPPRSGIGAQGRIRVERALEELVAAKRLLDEARSR